MFENGQWVIYGAHGVCHVVGREKQLVNRKRTEYLVLEPLNRNESRFYVPTANPVAMGKLKEVLSAQALKELLASDEIRQDGWIREENFRKQHYRELIGSGDRTALLKMVCTLYRYRDSQMAAGKKFHQCDDNFLRDAERLLSSEIALVLEMNQDDAKAFLREQLKPVTT